MRVFHGSIERVKAPEIREPNRTLDYGSGFYTTTSYKQAEEWVRKRMDDTYIHKSKGDTAMTKITQDNLYLLLPGKVSWVADMLCADKHISVIEALRQIYSSDMYKQLEVESSKMWHLGPVALYEAMS